MNSRPYKAYYKSYFTPPPPTKEEIEAARQKRLAKARSLGLTLAQLDIHDRIMVDIETFDWRCLNPKIIPNSNLNTEKIVRADSIANCKYLIKKTESMPIPPSKPAAIRSAYQRLVDQKNKAKIQLKELQAGRGKIGVQSSPVLPETQGDFTFAGLDELGIPLPWLVAGGLALVVVVLLVTRK